MQITVAQFGLGPIGVETVKRLAVTPWARVIGGIDIDPAKQAKDLAALTGEPSLRGKPVCADLEALLRRGKPDVIFHTSTSSFRSAWGQLGPMARRGISVVSSCEELIYPRLKEPRLAARLDQVCRKSGARIVGTGVNPGFVMDMLAVCLAMVSSEVRGVRVERVVDAATRRGPLQRKIGSGTAPAEFERLLRAGKAGHAGLAESLALLAHCLGWNGCRITEKGKAVIAAKSIHTSHVQVAKGQTCGIRQVAEGRVGRQVKLRLSLSMYLGAEDPHDEVEIEGSPTIRLVIPGGVAGDAATVAALVNTAPRLLRAAPGLRLLTELPVAGMFR